MQAKVWAASASQKLVKDSKEKLDGMFADLPERDCKRARARLRSCSGVGAQWLAAAPTSHLTQLADSDMRTATRFRLGLHTFTGHVCPHINEEGVECGAECDLEG